MVLESLSGTIPISFFWLIALALGWFLFLGAGAYLLMVLMFTHARTDLKTRFGDYVQLITFDDSRRLDKKLAKKTEEGTIYEQKLGPVVTTSDTMFVDKKTRAPTYLMFTKNSTTIPPEYIAILQEMKESGIKMTKYSDYKRLITLANSDEEAQKFIEAQKTQENKELVKKYIEDLRKTRIDIPIHKSFSLQNLGDYFPTPIKPTYIRRILLEQLEKAKKEAGFSNQKWIYIGIAVLVILIGGALAYNMMGGGATEVVYRTVQTTTKGAVETAKNTTNLTL